MSSNLIKRLTRLEDSAPKAKASPLKVIFGHSQAELEAQIAALPEGTETLQVRFVEAAASR